MSDTSRLRSRSSALLFAACACWTTPVHAWTRAQVEHVEAQLTVNATAQAQVALQLGVRVRGGWLSRFDITGLDPDLILDAQQPPTLTAEDGKSYAPRVETHRDGRIVLVFEHRSEAPHRGLHQVRLAYATQLKADGKRVSWSLPPWGVDLEDVRIRVDAPAGAVLGAESEDDLAVQRERIERDGRTLLSYRRAQLPRTLALALAFELAHEVAVPRDETTGAASIAFTPQKRPTVTPWVGALVLALCWLKRRAVGAMRLRYSVRSLPLLSLPMGLRAGAMLALALVFCFGYESHAALALAALASTVALAFDRGFRRAPIQRSAPEVPAARSRADARLQNWFGPAAWFDATTPLGLGLLGSAYALAALRLAYGVGPGLWLETLLLVTPLWLTSTRLHLPPQPMKRRSEMA